MIPIQEFIDVYGQELRMGASTEEHFTLSYNNSCIHYTVYNEKIEIRIVTPEDEKFSHHSITYDECMDWIVMFRRGVHGILDERIHYKRVSKGHRVITPELYNKILLLKEDVVYDHKILMMESGMKHGKT